MAVKGFRAAAVAANMRYKDRLDLGLIMAEAPAAWAGVFTRNICQAAPVIWSIQGAARGRGRAFLVNAGQANAQTGRPGEADCRRSAEALGALLGLAPEEMLLASTGIIGQPVNMEALTAALPALAAGLSPDGLFDFAEAILTTDTRAKTAAGEFEMNGRPVAVWGCAKGSGMMAPDMATMLAFLLTDAELEPGLLKEVLAEGAELSFNRVTVDGDTSTNDCLLAMASGAAGAGPVTGGAALEGFRAAAFGVMRSLARQIAQDGEGATRLVTIRVRGAATAAEARLAARTVAESPLVKTAFFGGDANWGRLCMALGRSGARFDPYAVDIDLDEVPWIRDGVDNGQEAAASAVMKKPEYVVDIDLKAGPGEYEALTCDLSPEYVAINGSYRS
ncbi:MAG: bifunctional glutamate N-acetyltransferase/amino-acid acetyltransferase ArgJ [Candidatus Adiutrix sp.]|jgi:glutamate N-acetyltransferase/amino-acid N-acetyltransferase|nr:bifunctional glutamate N-acetyltransferase/amino-acid acetyltransferase ArgJ [Candidatus Adiutrix sp.]